MDLNKVRAHVEILRYVKARKAELKEMEDNSRAAVEEAMGEQEVGMLDGELAITWKHKKVKRLNQKALKAAEPGTYATYCDTAEQRSFEVS